MTRTTRSREAIDHLTGARRCDASLQMLALNISGPSIGRAMRLLDALGETDPDVLVLSETRDNAGTRLVLNAYREWGYTVTAPTPPTSGERGVAVIHRPGVDASVVEVGGVDLPQRLVVTCVKGDRPFTLVGAYVPSRDASAAKIVRKRTFLSQLTALLVDLAASGEVVFLGDLNIVGRAHVPRYPFFRSWEYDALEAIASAGLVDAFEWLNPGVQAHSWIGRKGAGYRYDYGFVSKGLAGGLLTCEYVHDFRLAGLSDHAGFLVDLARPSALDVCAGGTVELVTV